MKVLFIIVLICNVARAQDPSHEDLRQTVISMQRLSKELGIQLLAAQEENKKLKVDTIAAKDEVHLVLLSNIEGLQHTNDLQLEVNEVTAWGNKKSKDAQYWHDKQKEAVKKLWWWRIWGWAAIILSFVVLAGSLLLKFTTWGAKNLGPIVAKVTAF